MAKGQMRSNREAKKPKKESGKKSPEAAPSSSGRSAYQQALKPKS
jgi:hypothetical protein